MDETMGDCNRRKDGFSGSTNKFNDFFVENFNEG
jgi:hypothetical protein